MSISSIITRLQRVDPITGFPEHMILGYSSVSSQSEHLARYLFAGKYVKGLILDLAAGSCYGSSILARNESNYVVSADVDKMSLFYGKRVFQRRNMDVVVSSAEYLPFRNERFESVVSIETLEHIKEPSAAIKQINRVMKAFGLLILSTPNKNVTSPIIPTPLNPHHFREYRLQEIRLLFESANFKIVGFFFQTPISLARLFLRIIGILICFLLVKLE